MKRYYLKNDEWIFSFRIATEHGHWLQGWRYIKRKWNYTVPKKDLSINEMRRYWDKCVGELRCKRIPQPVELGLPYDRDGLI